MTKSVTRSMVARPSLLLGLASLAMEIAGESVRWHTRRPPTYDVCVPYPGCKAPDVPRQICPFTHIGELCGLIESARKSGKANDSLIVEVGSAFGYGTFVARHYGHPILGFECRADEYHRLQKQFEGDRGVKMMNVCVGDAPGNITLFRAQDSSSVLMPSVDKDSLSSKRSTENVSQEIVHMVTLDHVLSVVDVFQQTVGMIAIDVQGAEGIVLRGAREVIRRHRPFIMYEDTELPANERYGKLFAKIMAEIGPEAMNWYKECRCERDCVCSPTMQSTF